MIKQKKGHGFGIQSQHLVTPFMHKLLTSTCQTNPKNHRTIAHGVAKFHLLDLHANYMHMKIRTVHCLGPTIDSSTARNQKLILNGPSEIGFLNGWTDGWLDLSGNCDFCCVPIYDRDSRPTMNRANDCIHIVFPLNFEKKKKKTHVWEKWIWGR